MLEEPVMRIMFAVPSYWPSQDGVANITEYLAEGLAGRGHEVLCFTSAGNGGLQDLPEAESHNGVLIERMRVYVRWPLNLKGRDEKSTRNAYWARIDSYQPDVLIVVSSQTWTLDWIKDKLEQIPCPKVFYCHGYSRLRTHYAYWEKLKNRNILGVWEEYLCDRYYRRLHRYLKRFDLAVYLDKNNSAVQYAKEHHLKNGKILKNAIDDAFFDERMKHSDSSEHKECIRFLFVANYSENKNHKMLIDAYADAQIGRSELVFAGFEDNEYLKYLKEYTKQILADQPDKNVVFHVHLAREEVIDLYRTCDIFTCSSKSETWSIVAHEAAATAMPIISTEVGIYGEMGGVILVHNIGEMSSAMESLYHDPVKRKRCGETVYRWLCTRNCRVEDKIDWLEAELKRLTAERGSRA